LPRELTALKGVVARLEGAATVLEAVAQRPSGKQDTRRLPAAWHGPAMAVWNVEKSWTIAADEPDGPDLELRYEYVLKHNQAEVVREFTIAIPDAPGVLFPDSLVDEVLQKYLNDDEPPRRVKLNLNEHKEVLVMEYFLPDSPNVKESLWKHLDEHGTPAPNGKQS
jgi:hypothetical protein